MTKGTWLRASAALVVVALLVGRSMGLFAAGTDYDIAQTPLFNGQVKPPLMMMVLSRDERLFTKAYSDYTDLNGDGVLDTTYKDTFPYSGYFDSKLCYTYANSQFKAAGAAGGANGHSCTQQWSGNFLNWITMSRLDVLRYVLYGGKRSTDSSTQTVLERAHIPNDLHAWVKTYSGADIAQLMPNAGSSGMSFCNRSASNTGEPQMRVAGGIWSEWASSSTRQCMWDEEATGTDDASKAIRRDSPARNLTLTVRVEVCSPANGAVREDFCAQYGASGQKPVGLLQTYGESGRLRFGLVSGSYSAPRSGGVLRKPIGLFAGNGTGCAPGNEVDTATGVLCASGGIVATLDNYKLEKWGGWTSNSSWSDCNTYSIYNRQGFGDGKALNNPGTGSYNCSAWGNPVAEMYAEALRYIAGETAATSGFVAGTDLANLPKANWAGQDPYRSPASGGNSYCAACNILVMSSSLPSFDSDEIPTVPRLGSASDATNAVGLKEGITGNYPVGRVGETPKGSSLNTHEDTCVAQNVTNLGLVRGICPDSPSTEGSYLMAGLAYKANTTDLRPGLQGKPDTHKNTVTTYAVALADNLPKFEIPVGGGKITLSPLCQANNSGSAKIGDDGWRTCFLGSVGVDTKRGVADSKGNKHVYGRELRADGKAGSFSLVWEDSLWGNDYDNDVVAMMTYCVGTTCEENTNPTNSSYTGDDICWRSDSPVCGANGSPNVGENEVLVRIENLSAYAGNAMLTGFAVSGSNDDGLKRLTLRPGSNDGSVLTDTVEPLAAWGKPKVLKFSLGASAKQLESPLWYAAKYGGFKDVNDNGEFDEGVDEWDTKSPGTPDNYFFARDPSKLKEELEKIFEKSSQPKAPTTGGGGGSRVSTDSFTLEASYELTEGSGNDWKGDVQAFAVEDDGSEGAEIWSAAAKLANRTDRNVIMVTTPTAIDAADGSVTTAVAAAPFVSGNIVGTDRAAQLQWLGMPTPIPTWFTGRSVDDFVGYIKGASTYEARNGGKLRSRSSPMGDIINSTSEIVSPLDNYGYSYWSSFATPAWRKQLGDSYKEFLEDKSTRKSMVYVGANDGMLHGFETSKLTSGGREQFAFIPSESRKNLAALLDPGYAHRYYVDGNLTSADVPFTATGDWRSVLIGAMGAGGRSVFALDVSNPSGFDADDVLWELSGASVPDVGYVMGKPVVVPIKGSTGAPRWVAMFGNGANSDSGAPVLFVVDIKTGEVLAQLKPSDSAYATRNGLMNIAPVSLLNNDGMVDTVYGGDLQGNLWKFDLSEASPDDWEVAFSGAPLFTAVANNVAQPITGGIEVSSGPGGGVSIFFGTGRYFAVGDEVVGANPPVQSLYGIWDNLSTSRVASRSELVEQTISNGTPSAGYQTRNVSNNPVNYGEKRGWFIDLKVGNLNKGERFIGTPRIQNGLVIFTTYEAGDATCSAGGGTNWLYAVTLMTGGGSMSGITLEPGGDSVCTGNCGGVALKNRDDRKTSPPVRDTSIFVPPPKEELCNVADPDCIAKRIQAEQCTFVLRAPGAEPLYLPRPCGRQSWRQVK